MRVLSREEIVEIARHLTRGTLPPDLANWNEISRDQAREIWALVVYEMGCIEARSPRKRRSQRRAYKLLRSMLSHTQNAQLTRSRYFRAQGNEGGTYRLYPATGHTEKIYKHGKMWFAHEDFCLHDPENEVPPADETIGHLLLISSDEPAFLKEANQRNRLEMLWNGDWLRTLGAARRRDARQELRDRLQRLVAV